MEFGDPHFAGLYNLGIALGGSVVFTRRHRIENWRGVQRDLLKVNRQH